MDSKGRQSSTSKFFGRRHKDKPSANASASETRPPAESPPGSAHGSQSSRHSNPHRHSASTSQASVDRPVFITPDELYDLLRQAGLDPVDRKGFVFNPVAWSWSLSDRDLSVNYVTAALAPGDRAMEEQGAGELA